jgi:hypothetical protein
MVNVDQMAQPAAEIASKTDGIPLRGKNPHYLGIRDWTLPSQARAVRGVIYARVPSVRPKGVAVDYATHLTWMRENELRKLSAANQVDSGQSLWIGLKQKDGDKLQWVQCGLRWTQAPDKEIGLYPTAYLETGSLLPQYSTKPEITRFTASPPDYSGGYNNVISAPANPLGNWHNDRIAMEFIMFKQFVKQTAVTVEAGSENSGEDFGEVQNPDGSVDITTSAWKVIFRQLTGPSTPPAASDYFVISAGAPSPNSLPQFVDEYREAYRAQQLNVLDACMETNQSVAFAPGKEDQKGGFEAIDTADALLPGVSNGSQPADGDKVALWNWLDASLNWRLHHDPNNERADLNLPEGNVKAVVRTGKNLNGQNATEEAEIGTRQHPTWRYEKSGNGVWLWDTQNKAFGQTE